MKSKSKILVVARPALCAHMNGKLGGVVVSSRTLLEYLENYQIPFSLIDTYCLNFKALKYLPLMFKVLVNLFFNDRVLLNLNEKEIIFFGIPITLVSRILRKNVYIRIFGGNLDLFVENNIFYSISIKILYLFSDKVFLQTKFLCNYFKHEKTYFFPTSRTFQKSEDKHHSIGDCTIKRIVFIGTISKDKGIDLIIEASKYFAGKVEFHAFGHLEDFEPEDLKISGIVYGGVIPNDQVQNVVSNFDYLCLPTFHNGEGYPGCIIEALLAGTPVIASNWRALPELVIPFKTGLLFAPNDIASFKRAIKSAIATEKKLFKKEIQKFAPKFDAKFIYQKFFIQIME